MINEDQIKHSFARAKQDILSLQSDLNLIKQELQEIKKALHDFSIYQSLVKEFQIPQFSQQTQPTNLQTNPQTGNQKPTLIQNPIYFPTQNAPKYPNYTENPPIYQDNVRNIQKTPQIPTDNPKNSIIQHIIPTLEDTPTQNPTDNLPLYALKSQYTNTSIGNDRVPTDKQTDKQTNQQTHLNEQKHQKADQITQIQKVSEILGSLDEIKKDLRSKFKKLTKQEILVFSTLYQLEEQGLVVDYPIIAKKLNLSESSIRDYVIKLINKGIPVEKTKENNKKIILSISKDLKKLASLNTILQLRQI